jgi:catechol 2,3-dioxygenase-like lactoylglutathione lyase family enzyme
VQYGPHHVTAAGRRAAGPPCLKERAMRGVALFAAGILVGLAVQTGLAQKRTEVYVNHVGIAVPSVPDALAFYTQKMGFREAFHQNAPDGKLVSAYVQVSRNTFIEIQEANAQRPAGVSHFGLAVDSIEDAVKMFRAGGATASDPGAPSAFSHARLANVTDLNGVRIELAELTPDSLQRKAIDSWK